MEKQNKKISIVLRILAIAAVLVLIVHVRSLHYFNNKRNVTIGNDTSSLTRMDLGNREGATSTWVKRDYDLYGTKVDLTGATFDAVLKNDAPDVIKDWTFKLEIQQDCFINQSWTGEVEIHQAVGTEKEVVQRINLQDYKKEDVQFEYLFDGDLLIPLQKGDYVIYYPNEKSNETKVEPGEEKIVGFIFYYRDSIDLTHYELDYSYNKTFTQGFGFVLFVTLVAVGLVGHCMQITSLMVFRKAKKEMELQKNGLACMSDLYAIIYIINLETDELIPVFADEEAEASRPKDWGAKAQMDNLFSFDPIPAYRDMILEFVDLDTVAERLSIKNDLVCEYISETFGWSRIRFFAMDRNEDEPIKKVVFTIQDINTEKKEIEKIQGRVSKAEQENKAKSNFLANMSHEIRTPINTVLGLDTMILRESKESHIRTYAREIKSTGNMLLSLINGILDFSKLEAGKMELVPAEYSFVELMYDIRNIIRPKLEAKGLAFKIDVDPLIPDKLYGDDIRIKQIAINLLTNATKYTEKGSVKISAKGKVVDGNMEILFSVKDTGMGIKEEDLATLGQRFSRVDETKNRNVEGTGIGLNLVAGLLKLMDSELKIRSEYGRGSEFSFAIKQRIVDPTPIGNVDFATLDKEDTEGYEASFTAPNARILVVDDNEMNLYVFGELLKDTRVQVFKATSGRAALELTAKSEFDIIFMDHMMPEKDGIETFVDIRNQKNGANAKTPVIMLTANALQGAREKYEDVGFDDFLSKPVPPLALEAMIVKHLPDELIQTRASRTENENTNENDKELPDISGVDIAYALPKVGDAANLLKIMKCFVDTAESERKELDSYLEALKQDNFDNEALKSYRVKVHSMKSSAMLIGALWVYGVAASLEMAARECRIKEIIDVTPHFLENWNSLGIELKEFFDAKGNENEEPKRQVDKAELDSLLHQLVMSMKTYDVKSADLLIERIGEYAFDEEEMPLVKDLRTAIANLDVESVEKIVEQLK